MKNVKEILKNLKIKIRENWIFIIIAIILFFALFFIYKPLEYSEYKTEVKYNNTIQGGRTLQLIEGEKVSQRFIAEKNNLSRIGLYSLMPSISTQSTVNVKVLEVESKREILNQDVFLGQLKDNEYFEINIENQFDSKGKEYEVIVQGVDGNELNSIQFAYSIDKNEYLTGAYEGEELKENNILTKLTYTNLMGLKKVGLIWEIIFVSLMSFALFGLDKKNLKKDAIFLGFTCVVSFAVLVLVIISNKTYNDKLVNLFKNQFGIISLMLTVVFGTSYYFILKLFTKKNIKLENVFILVVIPIGILYCLANPLGKTPDEITHATKALEISYGRFFKDANENGEAIAEYTESLEEIFSSKNETYEQYFDTLKLEEIENTKTYKYSNMALYFPSCHLAQAIGILVARILGGSLAMQLYFGRIANLLVSVMLIYFGIKYIPFKKIFVFLIALLPITLQEISCLSSDAIAISISIFYISYILHLIFDENIEKLNKKNIIILAISSIIVAMSKIVYIPLCIFIFLIPSKKFENKKDKLIKLGLIFGIAIIINLIWLMYSSRFLIEYNIGVNSKEQVIFILTHPIQYFFILAKTIANNFEMWNLGLFGCSLGVFGIQEISASYIVTYAFSILFILMILLNNEEEVNKNNCILRVVSLIIFLAVILLICTSLYVQFTRVANNVIWGIQPRYFIPVLLLLPIIFNNKYLLINKKIDYKYIIMFLIMANIHTITFIINTYLV